MVAKLTSFELGIIAELERDTRFCAWEKETQYAKTSKGSKNGSTGADLKKTKKQKE